MSNQMEIPAELQRPVRELSALVRDFQETIRSRQREGTTFARKMLERDDALRELLSHCETESVDENADEASQLAYDDVVIRLRGILDGES